MRFALVLVAACGGSSALHKVGTDKDDGHGELANASSRLLTSEGSGEDPFAKRGKKRGAGGQTYGGGVYGGYTVPNWSPPTVHRTSPKHQQRAGLTGAIEGTISWRGALPAKRATPCGPLDVVRVGPERGVPDVVVYIEQVKEGRTLPTDGRTSTVGGTVVKRGCALLPAAQIVTPLPAALAIHGDTKAAKLRVTLPQSQIRTFDLEEVGRAALTLPLGITRVDSADGSLAAAWVLASDAPYYAITDDRGQFRIDELATGTYDVTIWHAPLPDAGTGPITYGEPIVVRRKVTVDGSPKARPARLDLQIGR